MPEVRRLSILQILKKSISFLTVFEGFNYYGVRVIVLLWLVVRELTKFQ